MDKKDSFIKSMSELFDKHFGGSTKESTLQTIKKFSEEEMISIEPLYCLPMEADAHDDGMTLAEIRKMVDNINKNIETITGNIGHVMDTEGFYFTKAWVNECECKFTETGETIPEGQPIIKVQFVDKDLWEARKNGQLAGLSIGAVGKRIDNEDYTEEVS